MRSVRGRAEALRYTIACGILARHRGDRPPGAIVQRMDAETRAALQQLTSAEVQHPFRYEIAGEPTRAQQFQEQLRTLKLRFDQQLGLEA